jgi:hypothetical protein
MEENLWIFVMAVPQWEFSHFCCKYVKAKRYILPPLLERRFDPFAYGAREPISTTECWFWFTAIFVLINITSRRVENTNNICKFNGESFQTLFSHINISTCYILYHIYPAKKNLTWKDLKLVKYIGKCRIISEYILKFGHERDEVTEAGRVWTMRRLMN